MASLLHRVYLAVLPYGQSVLEYTLPLSRMKVGIGCITVGTTLAYRAGIIDLVKSKIFGGQRAPQLTPMRILQLLAGLGLVGYGLYDLAGVITRFWEYSYGTDPTATHPIFRPATAEDRTLAHQVIAKLKRCPAAEALWNQVEKAGKLSLRISSIKEGFPDANWNAACRTISLARSTSFNKKIIHSLFELCNGNQSASFSALNMQCEAGQHSLWQYIEKAVQIEWNSVHCHHKIASSCIASKHWGANTDIYLDELKKFPTFIDKWNAYLHPGSQVEQKRVYMPQWAKLCSWAYCRLHPGAMDC